MIRGLTLLATWLLWISVAILAGCGGGSGTAPTETRGTDDSPPVPLQFTANDIPDHTLRSCINGLAIDGDWTQLSDVDAIECPDLEIHSIEGLQQFPNLSILNISAPGFDLAELPILVSLPLADFQHQPFYKNGDRSSVDNVRIGLKQMLMQDSIVISNDQAVTHLVLVSHDPAQSDADITWSAEQSTTPSPMSKGKVQISDYVTLHWARQEQSTTTEAYTIANYPTRLDDAPLEYSRLSLTQPYFIPASQPLTALDLSESLAECVAATATARNWTMSGQFIELDCTDYRFTFNDYLGLRLLPYLQQITLNTSGPSYLSMLGALPYLETIHAPGLIVDPHDLAQMPWTFTPTPLPALAKPELSAQDCGLRIENFDSDAQYSLHAYDRNDSADWIYHPGQSTPILWSTGGTAHCMSLSTEQVWRVCANKADQTQCSDTLAVTNDQGQITQFIYELYDVWNSPTAEASMTLPGIPGDYYYVVTRHPRHVHLTQYSLATWLPTWHQETELLPLYATADGVYLIDNPLFGSALSRQTYFLSSTGDLRTLPPRPIAATPTKVLAFDGEIWFYGLHDDWGNRADLQIWNPVTEQWRLMSMRDTGNHYKLAVINDQLCVEYTDQNSACLLADGETWQELVPPQAIYSSVIQYDFLLPSMMDDLGLLPLLPLFGLSVDINDVTNPIELYGQYGYWLGFHSALRDLLPYGFSVYRALLDNRDPAQPVALGPVLPTTPLRSNHRRIGDTLYVIYNDSVARYDLTE